MKRRFATAAALVFFLATPALAQGTGEGRQRMGGQNQERMMETMFAGIELTAEQHERVKAITELFAPRMRAMREEMMAARESGTAPAPERMQAMRALNMEQRDSLRAVLTAEQQVVFDQNVQQMMQRRPPGERQRAAAWAGRGERRERSRIS